MRYFLYKPEHIKISLTNVCNYRCVMCYNPALKQRRGFIKDELLFKILDECRSLDIRKVSLGATGEPLMHKRFIDYLRYAKSIGLWVSTCTNCSLLTEEIARLLIREGIDRITLSNYSAGAKEHFNYTGTNHFNQVVENIEYFLNLWRKSESKIQLQWRFLEIPGINNYDRFVKFWGPLAKETGLQPFYMPLRKLQNWGGRDIRYSKNSSKGPFWLEKSTEGTRLAWQYKIRCPNIISCLYVGHDGNVYPCCNIPEAVDCKEVEFGNLNRDGIMDLWQSEKYLSFKRNHYNRNVSRYVPCRECSTINPVRTLRCTYRGFMDLGVAILNRGR